MKITVLMENQSVREGISCAHGLSLYIETAHHKILMDAGPDSGFAQNAQALGIDLAAVDTVVLSHGHYDHAGGLGEFMRINDSARIFAASHYDAPHYDMLGKYIGVEPVIAGHPRITVLDEDLVIDEEITILGFRSAEVVEDAGTAGMTEGSVDAFRKITLSPEKFIHEQDLLITDGGSRVLFSGCSHRGIVNIANWAIPYRPDAVFGGFHLMGVKKEDFSMLDHIAEELLKTGLTFYTGHCTGAEQFAYLKELMKDRLYYAAAGAVFEI